MPESNSHSQGFPNETASLMGADIREGVEILEKYSTSPLSEYAIRRRNQPESLLRVFPVSCNEEDAEVFYRRADECVEKFSVITDEPFAYIIPFFNHGIIQKYRYPFVETKLPEHRIDLPLHMVGDIQQILLVGEQVSRSLAICHNAGIVHGLITNKNIWYDPFRQYYMLDGFGVSLLNDAQRKYFFSQHSFISGITNADGKIDFHSDVMGLGSVLFRMLTGTTWNAHFATDRISFHKRICQVRNHKNEKEIHSVPEWFTGLVYLCLQGESECFTNALELYDHFLYQQLMASKKITVKKDKPSSYQPAIKTKPEPSVKIVKKTRTTTPTISPFKLTLSIAAAALVLLMVSGLMKRPGNENNFIPKKPTQEPSALQEPTASNNSHQNKPASAITLPVNISGASLVNKTVSVSPVSRKTINKENKPSKRKVYREGYTLNLHNGLGTYQVKSKAYFYTNPDESTKRAAHIVHWNNALLTPIKTTDDFIYIEFTNHFGQTSRGWLRKQDLVKVSDTEMQ